MEDNYKPRIVGAIVLVSLAIIFLPSLLYRENTEQILVDIPQQTIPTPPSPKTITIPLPQKPEGQEFSDSPIFTPELSSSETEQVAIQKQENRQQEESQQTANTVTASVPPKPELPTPRLTDQGVPESWVIQVASLSLKKSAEVLVSRLIEEDHPAYWQIARTDQGELYRVFVGPHIDKTRAEKAKQEIDRSHKVSSRVLRFNPTAGT